MLDDLPTPPPPEADDAIEDTSHVEDPLADDPAFATWPAEMREAWAEMKLPSLHDMLLGQERLAAEIRRQNQELRRLAQSVAQPVSSTADADALTRTLSEARTLGERLASAAAAGLIALTESTDRHACALDAAVSTLLARPAGHTWLGRARAWPEDLRLGLRAQVEGARLMRDKARQTLTDAGLLRIAPQPGDLFDPDLHRCLSTAPGSPGRVLRCERDGWRSGAALLRPAEVIVGAAASTFSPDLTSAKEIIP